MKLLEGNFFGHVCLSVHGGGGSPCDHYTMLPWTQPYRDPPYKDLLGPTPLYTGTPAYLIRSWQIKFTSGEIEPSK